MYLRFTQALRSHFPVFQNTNMLYHELKGHYFLYLTKYGTWEELREKVLDRATVAATSAPIPRKRRDLIVSELAFDRASIDHRLGQFDSHTLRPRYQSDLIEDDDRERFDRELEPETPEPSKLVYDPESGEIRCLSAAAAMLLARCDGSRTIEEIVEVVPEPVRENAARCVTELAGAGLLEAALEEAD